MCLKISELTDENLNELQKDAIEKVAKVRKIYIIMFFNLMEIW